jgi:beta-glucanase (GH16 family)
MVNPFNPATPYTSLYTAANGMARLGIQNNVGCGSACQNQPYLGSQILTQSFAQLHGYFEARISAPQMAGTGFAFWLMSASTWPPEIDIVEIVTTGTSSPAIAAQTLWDVTTSSIAGQCYSYETFPNYNATQFHTYGVDWTSATVTFYIDRVARCSFPTPAGYTAPMFPILSSQQGGDWSGPIPSGATLGPMQVDYVKVWASKPF